MAYGARAPFSAYGSPGAPSGSNPCALTGVSATAGRARAYDRGPAVALALALALVPALALAGRWTVTWPAAEGRGTAPPDGGRRPQCAARPAAASRTAAAEGSHKTGRRRLAAMTERPTRRPMTSKM